MGPTCLRSFVEILRVKEEDQKPHDNHKAITNSEPSATVRNLGTGWPPADSGVAVEGRFRWDELLPGSPVACDATVPHTNTICSKDWTTSRRTRPYLACDFDRKNRDPVELRLSCMTRAEAR